MGHYRGSVYWYGTESTLYGTRKILRKRQKDRRHSLDDRAHAEPWSCVLYHHHPLPKITPNGLWRVWRRRIVVGFVCREVH